MSAQIPHRQMQRKNYMNTNTKIFRATIAVVNSEVDKKKDRF